MDDFFGGIFDFNGDGHTDAMEQALGFMILDEAEKEERQRLSDPFDDPFADPGEGDW